MVPIVFVAFPLDPNARVSLAMTSVRNIFHRQLKAIRLGLPRKNRRRRRAVLTEIISSPTVVIKLVNEHHSLFVIFFLLLYCQFPSRLPFLSLLATIPCHISNLIVTDL